MAIRDLLASLAGSRSTPVEDYRAVEWLGSTFRDMVLGLTPEELYRTQPHLRIVLSFVARNVAHLGLKAYRRVSDTDRERLRDDPLARLLRRPNPAQTQYELLETLASDFALYDVAYWLVAEDTDAPSGWRIQPVPPSWVVEQKGGTFFEPGVYVVQNPDGQRTTIPADNMLVFHGWNPGKPKRGASPVETLKEILAEQVQAWSYRRQVWQRGGRVGAYLTRPKDAPWSPEARERFMAAWKERWTGNGPRAGGTPVLEDGMELKRLGFSAREEEWAEVSKLALSTVAAVYHVNPVMVGILDNANFSNTKEFRKMLYSETLGPQLARIEDRINTFLVPRIAADQDAYVEFNIEEKLQGDFEEQAAVISSSTGAPWMTRNEARALRNLPSIEGGDELVVPLNVLIGGQASPRDSGSQNLGESGERALTPATKARAIRAKAATTDNHVRKAEEVVRAFFERQSRSVLSALGSKAPDWWDAERWDRELARDLQALALTVTKDVALAVLAAFGLPAEAYDVVRTEAFLAEVAKSRAGAINATTRDQVQAILDGDGPEDATSPAHVFEKATTSRAAVIAATLITTFAAFATVEAARQNGPGSKTWIVTSSNPRPSHARMNGETVPLDSPFSNGAKWPGDPALGPDGVAGCQCDVEVTFG